MKHDIYSFINSKDIAAYCRKLKHEFTPVEAAYLIWRSERRTLYERHEAWKELIDTTSDTPIQNYHSLHELIRQYIKLENDYVERFYDNDNALYYCAAMMDYGRDNQFYPAAHMYKTIDECFNYINEAKKNGTVLSFFIDKVSCTERKDYYQMYFTADMQPVRIINNLSKSPLFSIFSPLCPIVLVPFERGDLLQYYGKNKNYKNRFGYKRTACVFDKIGYFNLKDNQKELDSADNYNAILYALCEDSEEISYIQIPHSNEGAINKVEAWGWQMNYLDLEYYQGEPEGDERILTDISNYLKGNINLSFLMNTYRVMNAEMSYRKMVYPLDGFYGIDEPLKLGGWTSDEVEKWEKAKDEFWERCSK